MQKLNITNIKNILESIHPSSVYQKQMKIVDNHFHCQDKSYDLNQFGNIYLLAMGKGAYDEANALKDIFDKSSYQIKDYLIITKKGYTPKKSRLKTFESTHPLVSEKSLEAAQLSFNFITKVKTNDLILFCLSGGASALVEYYIPEIELMDAQKLNQILLKSAISIEDFNLIRKSISQVKNGGLFKNLKGYALSFISCDIPSLDLYSVSSAPSLYHPLNLKRLKSLVSQYVPVKLQPVIEENLRKHQTYPKIDQDYFNIADATYLRRVAQKELINNKLNINLDPHIYNENLDTGKEKIITQLIKGKTYLSTGELNIKVTGNGKGGRNTHFVSVMALEIFYNNRLNLTENELRNVYILSLATDGSDGPTDATGAYFSYNESHKVSKAKLIATIDDNDSYHLFEDLDCLLKTGPSGTNLMDLRIICLSFV